MLTEAQRIEAAAKSESLISANGETLTVNPDAAAAAAMEAAGLNGADVSPLSNDPNPTPERLLQIVQEHDFRLSELEKKITEFYTAVQERLDALENQKDVTEKGLPVVDEQPYAILSATTIKE